MAGNVTVLTVNDWIVIQQRIDGTTSFYRTWAAYKNGFGTITGNYWMGNEKIRQLTQSARYKLRMEMLSGTSIWFSAEYYTFQLRSEAAKYKIQVGEYSGEYTDLMQYSVDPHYYHNGMYFTTSDIDNDEESSDNCATIMYGGWWYN